MEKTNNNNYYIKVKETHDFSPDLLKYDLEDIDNLLNKAKRPNVINQLKEMKSKIEVLLKNSNDSKKELEETKEYNNEMSITLLNGVKLENYTFELKNTTVNLTFEFKGINLLPIDKIVFHCGETDLLLIIKANKDHYFYVKRLSYKINAYTSNFKILEDRITLILVKQNEEDKWEKLEAQAEQGVEPGPNDIVLSVDRFRYLYETGTLEEKKRMREKFGDAAIKKVTGGI